VLNSAKLTNGRNNAPISTPGSSKCSPKNEKASPRDDKKIFIKLKIPLLHKDKDQPLKRKASPKLNQSHRNDSMASSESTFLILEKNQSCQHSSESSPRFQPNIRDLMKEAITNQLTSILKANNIKGQHDSRFKLTPQINVSINNNINNFCIDEHFHSRSRSKCSRENSVGAKPHNNNSKEKTQKNDKSDISDDEKYKINDSISEERKQLINYNMQYSIHYNNIPPTTLSYYKLIKLIGSGSFGKVLLAQCLLNGKYVAIKAFDKEYLKDEYSKGKVTREIYIQRNLTHENIIKLYEVFYNETHLFIVMEYASNGDMLHYLKNKKKLVESEARKFFRQLVYGLAHIHCRNVLHRDIKLDNILLDEDMGVKICDFGVSRIISKSQIIKEQCGTPAYLAPEIIINKGYSSFYSDMWSLGIVLYTMICGAVPYRGSSLQELLDSEINKEIEYPSFLSPSAKDLIQKLLQFEPTKRVSFPEIFKHPWFTGEINPTTDDNMVEIREPKTDKEDVTIFRPSNLFLRKMPKKISSQDYSFIYREHSENKLGSDLI
jgi:hypothetical protein